MVEQDTKTDYEEEETENGIFRWMSWLVVLLAVAGFFGLAWYAYHSGVESVDERDVELVKAEPTPVKEAPANPGGIDIPHQDKTVYNLVNGGRTQKATVEHVLPSPEEPMARDAVAAPKAETASNETGTWINDKLKAKTDGVPETAAPAVDAEKKPGQFQPSKPRVETPVVAPAPKVEVAPAPVVTPAPVAVVNAPAVPEPTQPKEIPVTIAETPAVPVVKKEEKPAPVAPKKVEAKKAESKPVAASGNRAQLGAYKSETEAQSNWSRISKKFPEALDGKNRTIVRADLGEKGVYYRLQVTPFDSAQDAESFCLDLVSEGQGCFLAKGK